MSLRGPRSAAVLAVWVLLSAGLPARADINLVVQPIIDRQATIKAFTPLARYIASLIGTPVALRTAYDFAEYFLRMKQGTHYDLILDSAFYTDYRIRTMRYTPLVKIPGKLSNSLVARSDAGYMDAEDLVGKRIACQIPPSPQGLVLARMFPNSLRQPVIIAARNSDDALRLLSEGRADAAMIPTPLVGRAMANGMEISVLEVSEQTPHLTLSAGPQIDETTRAAITAGLLNAQNTPAGQAMLKSIGFPGFERTHPDLYKGLSAFLEEGWVIP